jgi:hypothetical protein
MQIPDLLLPVKHEISRMFGGPIAGYGGTVRFFFR